MALDPQIRAFLDTLAASGLPPVETLTPREARLQMEAGSLMLGRLPEVGRAEDLTAPGPAGPVRLRLTAPAPATTGGGPLPALVYLHGGGWVTGSLFSHGHLCRALALTAGLAVVAVDYRLAPEHPFPAPLDDAEAATRWVVDQAAALGIDPARVSIGGDSAGGALAAAVARRLRDQGGPPLAAQLLVYPATDADFDTPSYLAFAEGYMLTRAAMIWYWDQYLPDPARRADPDAAPLRADRFEGLPPAVVITAEYDPLRDEGEAYARRLADASVTTRLLRYDGMIHGFLRRYRLLDRGRPALEETCAALRALIDG